MESLYLIVQTVTMFVLLKHYLDATSAFLYATTPPKNL